MYLALGDHLEPHHFLSEPFERRGQGASGHCRSERSPKRCTALRPRVFPLGAQQAVQATLWGKRGRYLNTA
jgi:hypothetical protein